MKLALFLLAVFLPAALPALAAEEPAALAERMRQQLVQHPDDLDARFELARALARQDRLAEALAEFSSLLEARPDNPDFLLGMAQVQYRRGAPELALPLLAKARALAPDYEDVWRAEIQALLAVGDAERLVQARRTREEARARFPRSDWSDIRLDAVAAPAPAVITVADRYEWEAGASHETLTHGYSAWRSRYLTGEWHLAGGGMLYGGLRDTRRYDLDDSELHVGGVLRLDADTQLQAEAGLSDSHRVLARHYGLLQIHYRPTAGWELGAGWRRSNYDTGQSQVFNVSVDRYVGAERFGYTLYEGGPQGAGLSASHRVQWAHYYGDRDWIGLSLNHGRETEYAGNAGFVTSRVSGAALAGRHEFTAGWTLAWEAGSVRQGDFYTRSGVRLGLRHAF